MLAHKNLRIFSFLCQEVRKQSRHERQSGCPDGYIGLILCMPIGRRRQFTEQQWDLMGKVLTKASSNVTYTINKMPRVDLPPDIASKFPSLVQWWEQYNEMMEKWREELNKTLYG